MPRSNAGWRRLTFAAALLAVGVPYWSIPYGTLNLPDALPTAGLAAVAVGALLLRATRRATTTQAMATGAAAVPAAVLARVVVEGALDPSTHNLFPIELVIALAVGFAWALAGALLGSVAAGLTSRETASVQRSRS